MTTRQQQSAYLQAMGIQAWERRIAPQNEARGDELGVVETPLPVQGLPSSAPPVVVSQAVVPASAVALPERVSPSVGGAGEEEPPPPTDDDFPSLEMCEAAGSPLVAAPPDVSRLDWPALQSAVAGCTACELHRSRRQTVFGVGNRAAEWMVIGEAPKADEEQQGEPFVGDAGQLLNNMLRALGLSREQVFISNILKCRPPEDRDPRPAEMLQCEVYLQRQIALVAPRVILAMGAVAAHHLLKVDTAVTKLRGQLHHYGDTPLVVTYHPAYLLHKPSEKANSWADLRFAASVVAGSIPPANDGGRR